MEKTREERIDAYVDAEKKSPTAAFLLALLIGPLGYLYVSVGSGLSAILLAIGLALLHPGLVVIVWLMCVIAAPFEIVSRNKKLRAKAELMAS